MAAAWGEDRLASILMCLNFTIHCISDGRCQVVDELVAPIIAGLHRSFWTF
jgi:hypothetical protein